MGRKSKADKAIESVEKGEDREGVFWVVYDFSESRNPSRFYVNLRTLFERYEGFFVQLSVVEMKSLKGAKAVRALARSYGAKVLMRKLDPELYSA